MTLVASSLTKQRFDRGDQSALMRFVADGRDIGGATKRIPRGQKMADFNRHVHRFHTPLP
jgi:hypothetical protein